VNDSRLRLIAAGGLVVGAVLGMAGTFAPSAGWRGLAWGLDGTALVVATALLTIHHLRKGNEILAAGFLVFVVGEGLILSGAAMDLQSSAPSFAAGVATVRTVGFLGSLLFTVVAGQIFWGRPLTPLSEPLPFFAIPSWRQRCLAGRGCITDAPPDQYSLSLVALLFAPTRVRRRDRNASTRVGHDRP
jgi:hypothetical protein